MCDRAGPGSANRGSKRKHVEDVEDVEDVDR